MFNGSRYCMGYLSRICTHILVSLCVTSIAVAGGDDSTASDLGGARIVQSYLIHAIEFDIQGDSLTGSMPSALELGTVINSRACDFSVTSRLLRSLTYESMAHKGVPTGIVTTLVEFYTRSSRNELRFFDRTVAGLDVYLLQDFFTQMGYHDVYVRFRFHVSVDRRANVLTFIIRPRRQYTLDTVVVAGIESVAPGLKRSILNITQENRLSTFNEPQISVMVNRMLGMLHDSGYAFARLPQRADESVQEDEVKRYIDEHPIVYIDTVNKKDSVTIYLEPQGRYYFGNTSFIDSTHGYPFVVDNLKRQQLEFRKGLLYDLGAVRRSESVINALGPFDRVAIDTLVIGDTINTTVFCSYKRNWEVHTGLFLNNTFPDNFNNFGAEANYINRNVFHDANVVNLYARYTVRNADRYLFGLINGSPPNFDQEIELGGLYSQPDFMRVFGKRADGTIQLNYSRRFIVDPLKVQTLNLRLSPYLPLNNNTARLQFDLILESQLPFNFKEALNSAVETYIRNNPGIDTTNLRAYINERLDPYKKLDNFTDHGTKFAFSSIVLSSNYFLDQRNDLFFPSRGYTANISLEGTPVPDALIKTLTNFIRIQGTYTNYNEIAERIVGAWKIRGGHIVWLNKDSSVVPSDRHYFAGGANSVRSFASRTLGDLSSDDANLPSNVGDLANYVGWASIIELSAEIRYTFGYYRSLGDFLADKISKLGITFFADAGNAFNRLTPQAYGRAKLGDVLSPSKWALAIGAGLRYATPVGPARLDFGINMYDPTISAPRYQWIGHRKFIQSIALQISLGQTF